MPSTIRLHRVIAAKPEKLYRAFLEPDAIASWLPPYGFTCTVHELDAKVGGNHRMSFRNFTTGDSHSFGGIYLELVAGERLVYTDKFDDPNLPGEMKVTVDLKPKQDTARELSREREHLGAGSSAIRHPAAWVEMSVPPCAYTPSSPKSGCHSPVPAGDVDDTEHVSSVDGTCDIPLTPAPLHQGTISWLLRC